MGIGQKRKRRWGSKGFFGFRPAKIQALENLPDAGGNETTNRSGVLDGFIEGSNSEDANNLTAGTAAKIRRTGSRILSIVRFAVASGMYNGMIWRDDVG